MADYRKIYVKIWADPDFQKYSAEGKLLFIYLCTNPLSSESGIYTISPNTIANDTAICLETVYKLLSNRLPTVSKQLENSLKNVYYDSDNYCIFIANFRNYNPGGAPELIKKSIQKDFRNTYKASFLWLEFLKRYPNFLPEICPLVNMLGNSFQTVYKHINTNTYTNTNTTTNTNTNGDNGGSGEKGKLFLLTLNEQNYQIPFEKITGNTEIREDGRLFIFKQSPEKCLQVITGKLEATKQVKQSITEEFIRLGIDWSNGNGSAT